ncbi:MAG: tRNA 2-thiouridine(34) synthase MnmA [Desulforegulaceae bacterium]|nr:tRNA 2-thiouridine(34) synthase MnmA [Desulforegulaceae bacterium]
MKEKIAAAVSGGIDSLVAAFILKRKNYDVTGIHFFTGYESKKKDQIKLELTKMCSKIDIPVIFIDIEKEFNEKIVSYFKNSYIKGYTPNPCLICNQMIKFKLLFDEAKKININKIATGHYVKIIKSEKKIFIAKANDPFKDQSYFLSMVSPDNIKNCLFPIGNLKKNQVKKIAENFCLVPSEKDESQDICFIKNKNYKLFLEQDKNLDLKPGKIIDRQGKIIGSHNGVHNFTIGQRKGINCPGPYPYYVLETDPKNKTVIIGKKEDLYSNSLIAKNFNWFQEPQNFPFEAEFKIRYSHKGQKGKIFKLNDNLYKVIFNSQASSVTPGQGLVVYDNQKVIGAGFISKNEKI